MSFILGLLVGLCCFSIFILMFGGSFAILYGLVTIAIISISFLYFKKYDGGVRQNFLGNDFDYEVARKRSVAKWNS